MVIFSSCIPLPLPNMISTLPTALLPFYHCSLWCAPHSILAWTVATDVASLISSFPTFWPLMLPPPLAHNSSTWTFPVATSQAGVHALLSMQCHSPRSLQMVTGGIPHHNMPVRIKPCPCKLSNPLFSALYFSFPSIAAM